MRENERFMHFDFFDDDVFNFYKANKLEYDEDGKHVHHVIMWMNDGTIMSSKVTTYSNGEKKIEKQELIERDGIVVSPDASDEEFKRLKASKDKMIDASISLD